MGRSRSFVLLMLFLAAQMSHVMPSKTVPAFLWSSQHYGSSQFDTKEVVDYRRLSPKDLAKSVLFEGGWSNLVCSGENLNQNMDVTLVYVGRRLQSSDISKTQRVDSTLLNLLKTSFMSSNISLAFPYITASDEKDTLENSLVSGLIENCGNGLGVNQVAYTESCSVHGENFKKLQGLQSLKDFVGSRMETGVSGKTDLIVFCDEGSEELDEAQSEGKSLSALVSFLEKLGATFTVLYASDPYRIPSYPHIEMGRFLVEEKASVETNLCDGVCQIKSSLLEGLFVGLVLLIILISGLCCMMGIDTPTRFEAPQES